GGGVGHGGPYDLFINNPGIDTRTQLISGTVPYNSGNGISAPTITGIYEDSPKHFLSSNSYDLIINGTGFESWPGFANALMTMFYQGSSQTNIAITSTTYVTPTQLRASVVIGTNLNNVKASPGPTFDLYVT